MKKEYKIELVIGGVLTFAFCAGGAALIALGWASYQETQRFVSAATSARGKVIGFEKYDAPGASIRDDLYYATVAYETRDGQEVRFRGPSRDGPVDLQDGDEVEVLYDPDDPAGARVRSFMGLWFSATMLVGIGTGAIVIPLLTMWQAWKWVQRQEE